MSGEHGVRFLGLLEEASLAPSFTFHHQIVMFGLHCNRLLQIIVHIALIARVHVHPEQLESA